MTIISKTRHVTFQNKDTILNTPISHGFDFVIPATGACAGRRTERG